MEKARSVKTSSMAAVLFRADPLPRAGEELAEDVKTGG
jgi:hypothetical protein